MSYEYVHICLPHIWTHLYHVISMPIALPSAYSFLVGMLLVARTRQMLAFSWSHCTFCSSSLITFCTTPWYSQFDIEASNCYCCFINHLYSYVNFLMPRIIAPALSSKQLRCMRHFHLDGTVINIIGHTPHFGAIAAVISYLVYFIGLTLNMFPCFFIKNYFEVLDRIGWY